MPPSQTSSREPSWLLPLLLLLFFGSGVCALIYQVMWLRLLSLVFGVTVYAGSTVLAGFMAGLGLGSFLGGRFAATFPRPLIAFGVAEAMVGVTAFATPFALDALTAIWIAVYPQLPQSLAMLTVIRFVVAFLVLIVPTSLMGATLPLVIKSAVARQQRVGGRIGLLYAINTAGAITGALAAGFYFISELGVSRSFQIAAAANIAIGVVAVAAGMAMPRQEPQTPVLSEPLVDNVDRRRVEGQQRLVLWTFFVSGVLSLAIEIIWFRMLVVFLRPTAYAFTIMLACVLGGIALGSAIASPLLRRRRNWLVILAAIQGVIGVAAVLSFNLLSRAQAAIDALAPWFERAGLNTYLGPLIISSLIAMLPTTLMLGLAFPMGLTLWTGDSPSSDTSRRAGSFYSVNVAGAILGSVLAGFVLLPLFGTRTSLIAVAALATISSVLLALSAGQDRRSLAIAVASPMLFVIGAVAAVDPFDVAFDRFHRNETLLWREEGAQTTVAVHQRGGSQPMKVMFLDGNHQANDSAATAFVHHRIGALPVMLHPNPRTALVVGLGGGATPGAVARLNVDVDVVELSPAVVAGSDYFKDINFNLLERPNVTLKVDDGRNFLMMSRKKYDVITADIILPRHAGAGALYSREYYELVRDHLAEGGVAMQWNGGDSETEYKLLMRTFVSVFPYTTLWGDGSLMLGSVKPFTLSQSAYEARRATFEQFPWDIATLKRIFIAGPEDIRAFVGEGPVLTDDKPMIEYFLSLPIHDAPGGYTGRRAPIESILVP